MVCTSNDDSAEQWRTEGGVFNPSPQVPKISVEFSIA